LLVGIPSWIFGGSNDFDSVHNHILGRLAVGKEKLVKLKVVELDAPLVGDTELRAVHFAPCELVSCSEVVSPAWHVAHTDPSRPELCRECAYEKIYFLLI
jgi:hypothetical protein